MFLKERLFYVLAGCLLFSLLIEYPSTLILALLFSLFIYPLYRKLGIRYRKNERTLLEQSAISRLCHRIFRPYASFVLCIFSFVLAPVISLIVLVAPQIAGGLQRLKELQSLNFHLPQSWIDTWQSFTVKISAYPHLEKMLNDATANLDDLINSVFKALINKSMAFFGGTMSFCWSLLLFVFLILLFVRYARSARRICCRVLSLPMPQLRRILAALQRALQGVILGIVFVAVVQGLLCGLGFAVAGAMQPAFWGLLATFVAPIPIVGTALVWLPLTISLWFSGKTVTAVLLALYCIFVVSGIDNILRPLFLRKGINAPLPVLILTIVLGMSLYGALGLVVAPIVLALAVQLIAEADRGFSLSEWRRKAGERNPLP